MNLIKKIIALYLLTLVSLTYAQMTDNWTWMNPKPQGNTLNAIDFIDNNTGYSVGNYGTMLKTDNGGISWSKVNTGLVSKLQSVFFINSGTGFIGGAALLLKKTTDGGANWSGIQLPSVSNYDILDIEFAGQNTGYVLGFWAFASKIWKTTDGGLSWTEQGTGGANYLKRLYFFDESTGFAVGGSGYCEIIKTTNGGASWQMVGNSNFSPIYSLHFLNQNTGFAAGDNGTVLKTTDSGNSWLQVGSPSNLGITSLTFTDPNTGFGTGLGSVYVKTIDGGATWFEASFGLGSIRNYLAADLTPNGTLHVVGTYGAIIRSTNSGTSWISQSSVTEKSISDIAFVNNTTGYAVAGFGLGEILKTTDAGTTWVSQVTSNIPAFYGIAFVNAETGYLAGSLNIYKTTNGGGNWSSVYTNATGIYNDVFFTNVNTGYVVGNYGKLLKTTDAGNNWSISTIPGNGSTITSIFFVNDNTGYSVGDFGTIAKTTDAGVSWVLQVSPTPAAYNYCVMFTDENKGYISTGGGILLTTDGGTTWSASSAPVGGYNKVQFMGNFGYAVGSGGKIIKSTNSGSTWIVQPTVTDNPLYALYFNSDNYVYAGGVRGTMIKTIPSELILTPVNGNHNEAPKNYYLSQNYPNPFNPSTTIKFGLTKPQTVGLTVFDITGRAVEKLVDGNFNAGTYEINWDASKYSSGIYFYVLRTNEFSETKKMMLVK